MVGAIRRLHHPGHVAVLVVAVLTAVAACSSPAATPTPTPTPTDRSTAVATRPTSSAADVGATGALRLAAHNRQITNLVSVPGGLGRSAYPTLRGFSCDPKLVGAAVRGAPDATFIVNGCFTGDGVLNSMAFANGPHGWGAVQRKTARRLGSVGRAGTRHDRPYSALHHNMEFAAGLLETLDGNEFFADGGDMLYPLETFWRWSGSGFVRTRDNAFTAAPASSPAMTSPALPGAACPTNGTYRASFGVQFGVESRVEGRYRRDSPLRLIVFPPRTHYPVHPTCQLSIPADLRLTVLTAHTTADKIFFHRGTITNRRWLSAPAWFLLHGDGFARVPFYPRTTEDGQSVYVVAKSVGVNEILSRFHEPPPRYPTERQRRHAHPDQGTVTLRAGNVVAIGVTASEPMPRK